MCKTFHYSHKINKWKLECACINFKIASHYKCFKIMIHFFVKGILKSFQLTFPCPHPDPWFGST